MKKRVFATALALSLALAMAPVAALANETQENPGGGGSPTGDTNPAVVSGEDAANQPGEKTNVPAGPVARDGSSGPASGKWGPEGNALEWKFENNILTISGNGQMQDIKDTPPWQPILSDAKDQNVKVVVGSGVTSIGDRAFDSCNVTEIQLPSSVKSIGKSAFANSELTTIKLPDTVTTIGDSAFSYCDKLKEITWPKDVTSIGDKMFQNCTSLAKLTILGNVTSIGNDAVSYCSSLTELSLPGTVTSIGSSAFTQCKNLTTINLPEGVTSIGAGAFYLCSSLTKLTIPEGVTSIGDRAFMDCQSLTEILWPKGTTTIGEEMFNNCSSLKKLTIPAGVTSIGNSAFFNCSSLAELTLPGSLATTGVLVFPMPYNSVLKDIYYGGSMSDWGKIKAIEYQGSTEVSTTIDKLEELYKTAVHCTDGISASSGTGSGITVVQKPADNSGTDRISGERMKEMVKRSETEDVAFTTASGLTYTFQKGAVEIRSANGLSFAFRKGDFNPVGVQTEYDFSTTMITDFAGSAIQNPAVKEEDFAGRINFAHSGLLPGTAQISIPVDPKWNGKTLYYYQIMANGILKDTGVSAVVADGVCKVSQDHCSDYVLLAKSPEVLGVPRYIADGNGGTDQPQQNSAAKNVILAQTGDATNITVYAVLMILAAGGGVFALARARRKRHDA